MTEKFTLVRDFLMQGKPTKGSTMKSKPQRKQLGKQRASSVAVERKENMIFPNNQPSCSYMTAVSQRAKQGPRITKPGKTKSKKDLLLKNKASSVSDKPKIRNRKLAVSSSKLKTDVNSKLQTMKETNEKSDHERVQLREICFLKTSVGKTLIAKYNTGDEDDVYDDNLVVSWEGSASTPHVFSHKSRMLPLPFRPMRPTSEPGTSKQGSFRVHNFSKSSSYPRNKSKKHTLRRLVSASDSLLKTDKVKKKKKLKTK